MHMQLFIKSFLIGFLVVIPVGPVALLCIRRTLAHGPLSGFISGLGSATADAFLAFIAAVGLTFISYDFIAHNQWIRIIGGLILCFLGGRIIGASVITEGYVRRGSGIIGDYISTFLLTMTNPLTILALAAAFAGFGISAARNDATVWSIAVGVSLGSLVWWALLVTGAALLRKRLGANAITSVNRFSGSIILFIGVITLLTVFLRNM